MELEALAEQVAAFGPVAFLVTAGADQAPHVVSVAPEWRAGALVATAGSRTSGNVAAGGQASLLWPALPGGDYCLIVDGAASVGPDGVAVAPTRAVLHRLASADGTLPSCVTVL